MPYLSGVESSRANIRAKGLPYSLRLFFNGLQVARLPAHCLMMCCIATLLAGLDMPACTQARLQQRWQTCHKS